MAEKRPSKAEIDLRIEEICGLLLTRLSRAAICRYAVAKWHVTPRQNDRYIARARQRICALLEPDQREQLAMAVGAYDTIFAKQMAASDLRGAAATLTAIVNLRGLAGLPEPQRRVTLEDIDREIALLDAELAVKGGPA